ncbi:MAG: Ig-like domain-containing protein, partial [Acidimicrobiales bacterium]
DILTNDDFLPGPNTTITRTGGTATGTTTLDPLTGELTYTPAPDETGEVSIVYRVCDATTGVCSEATIMVTVETADGGSTPGPAPGTGTPSGTGSLARTGGASDTAGLQGLALLLAGTGLLSGRRALGQGTTRHRT